VLILEDNLLAQPGLRFTKIANPKPFRAANVKAVKHPKQAPSIKKVEPNAPSG
jgi:hypothetical protein